MRDEPGEAASISAASGFYEFPTHRDAFPACAQNRIVPGAG